MKKRFLAIIFAAVLLLTNVAVAYAATNYDIDTAKHSVVRIVVEFNVDPAYNDVVAERYRNATLMATGSGFAVGDPDTGKVQHFVTAAHVTMHNDPTNPSATSTELELSDGTVAYVPVVVTNMRILLSDESVFVNAHFMGRSDRADVALIAIPEAITNRTAAVLRDAESFATNESVSSMGFPGVSDDNLTLTAGTQLISTTDSVTVSAGVVSVTRPHATTNNGDQIQTTASMDFGISGGPLVDKDGYVVGVCTSGSATNQSTNWAVATSEIVRLLKSQTGVKYVVGPLGQNVTMIIIIIAAVLVIAVLVALILMNAKNKNNVRTLAFEGEMAGKTVTLKKGESVVIGRDPTRCKVIYPKNAAGVSSVHCTITFDGTQVLVADNASSYGTTVGGAKVEPGRPVVMHRGQEICFGSENNSAVLH